MTIVTVVASDDFEQAVEVSLEGPGSHKFKKQVEKMTRRAMRNKTRVSSCGGGVISVKLVGEAVNPKQTEFNYK